MPSAVGCKVQLRDTASRDIVLERLLGKTKGELGVYSQLSKSYDRGYSTCTFQQQEASSVVLNRRAVRRVVGKLAARRPNLTVPQDLWGSQIKDHDCHLAGTSSETAPTSHLLFRTMQKTTAFLLNFGSPARRLRV